MATMEEKIIMLQAFVEEMHLAGAQLMERNRVDEAGHCLVYAKTGIEIIDDLMRKDRVTSDNLQEHIQN